MIRLVLSSLLFIAPSFYSTCSSREFWPFSNYPMYSERVLNRKYEVYRIYGVNPQVKPQALLSFNELQPLLRHHVDKKFKKLDRENKLEKINELLKYYKEKNNYQRVELRKDTLFPKTIDNSVIISSELLYFVGHNDF